MGAGSSGGAGRRDSLSRDSRTGSLRRSGSISRHGSRTQLEGAPPSAPQGLNGVQPHPYAALPEAFTGPDLVYEWPSGAMYRGGMRKGKLHIYGRMVSASGSVYEGEWKNDEKHGWGQQRVGRDQYDGQWSHGDMWGVGRCVFADGGGDYLGEVCRGCIEGFGVFSAQGGAAQYVGDWAAQQRRGLGRAVQHPPAGPGSWYQGSWADDQEDGLGLSVITGVESYFGPWRGGKRCGTGVLWGPTPESGGAAERFLVMYGEDGAELRSIPLPSGDPDTHAAIAAADPAVAAAAAAADPADIPAVAEAGEDLLRREEALRKEYERQAAAFRRRQEQALAAAARWREQQERLGRIPAAPESGPLSGPAAQAPDVPEISSPEAALLQPRASFASHPSLAEEQGEDGAGRSSAFADCAPRQPRRRSGAAALLRPLRVWQGVTSRRTSLALGTSPPRERLRSLKLSVAGDVPTES